MLCELCGGQTATKKVKRQHWLQGKLCLVENVDAEVCKDCGERSFHAITLDEIEQASTTALLSEQALAVDWNRPEEDEAWSHLEPYKKLHAQK